MPAQKKRATKKSTKATAKKAAKKSAVKKAAKPKKAAKKATAKKAVKKKPLRKGPDTEVTQEVLEFIRALDDYKKEKNRPFPTWSEVLEVIRRLGYRKQ